VRATALSSLAPPTHTQQQNRRNTPERLELKKFNPNLRRYTIHREVK
jgi:large subunit ribosomal protein L33